MTDTLTATETVDLYRKENGEIIGTPALVDDDNLEKKDIIAAINNAGASVYVNDSGVVDRVYINIEYDDEGYDYDSRVSFVIDADLPSEHRLRRSLQNADLFVVRSPDGKLTLASFSSVDEEVQGEIQRSADNTYKVLKIIDDEDEDAIDDENRELDNGQ